MEMINGQKTERLRTIVVRSDRTMHVAKPMLAPPNTPKEELVYRLGVDGTLLRRQPVPSTDSTWRWASARAFIYEDATAPPLELLLHQIASHLKASVWLPFKADYLMLACIVATTFCQQIFDAVPLVLVTGPKGSGKTELSGAICQLAANSPGPVGLIRLEIHSRATRFYSLSRELLDKALALANVKREDVAEDCNPRAFCASCATCDYQEICDMRPRKLRADARANARHRRLPASAEKSTSGDAGLH